MAGTRRVFAAVRARDQERVVVKRSRLGYPAADESAALRHEFAVLSRLRGAPVVEARDFIEDPSPGLVLALAPGRSLDTLLGEAFVDLPRFVAWARSMAQALAAIHARGFVHRDVKPHHFFIDETSGQALLIDFGLATQLVRQRQVRTEADEIQGTLAYISPEQTGRTSHSVDARSDLYSFGVTLYELWTGKRPFESEDALELIHAHIARKPAPLHVHRPGLPKVVEDIVMCLLAKSPEDRYQTSLGLLADLERVAGELTKSGTVTPFALKQRDYDGALRVPEKLYGRDEQREAILKAVRAVQHGARTFLLLEGPAGVGKSALVQEVRGQIVRGTHFVWGKFDPYSRTVPYSAVAAACSELVRVYLASTASELEDWRRRLRLALGDNARVISDVVPELVVALGEQPSVPELSPSEAQARFERTFRRFMEASACREAPLVIFLDDLQWADTASLALLELVLSSQSQQNLLVIGSYRDSEVDATHALSRLLERLKRNVQVERVSIEPLSPPQVRQLVTDALPLTQSSSEPLAALIFRKTSGNPFFIGQFLERLSAEGHLRFEPRGYVWDLETIETLAATDNVVDLVVARLAALDVRTQQLLRLAACIGHTFQARTLAVIAGEEPHAVLRALLPAVKGGYLLPLDPRHRLVEEVGELPSEPAFDVSYRFAHDRVQQAALATYDATERARVHLRIGRMLLSAAGEAGPSEDHFFEVVTQLNLGHQHVTAADEKLALARLNLRAARRAAAAAAHASATQFAELCLQLLGEDAFAVDRALCLDAHFVAAESYHLVHDEARALELISVIEANAESVLERVPARNLKTTIITHQGRPQEATAVSVETLALLGVTLPDIFDAAALGPAIGEAFGAYQAALGSREVADLCELPTMTDPEKLAQVSTLAFAIPAVFQWNPSLSVLLVLRAVRLPLEHGNAPLSPFFYAQYGIVHHVITGDAARAHDFGLLALTLCGRTEHATARGGVEFIYAAFLAPWVRARAECSKHFKRGVEAGLDTGDQLHAGYCMAVGVAEGLYAGQPVQELQADSRSNLTALEQQGDVLNHLLLTLVDRGLACLRGETSKAGSMDGEGFTEQGFEAEAPPPIKAHFGAIKGMLRFLFGDFEEARRVTEAITPPPGVDFKVEYVFYHGMACAELARAGSSGEREALLNKAEADLACFETWVRVAPGNFLALQELLRAELHAAREQAVLALDAYDRALDAAWQAGARHHLALAYERTGRFQLRSNRRRLALLNLGAAARQYEQWGAAGKVLQLGNEFPELAAGLAPLNEASSSQPTFGASITGTGATGGSRLDLQSAMRAVGAIASEIRLQPLLRRLTQILLENAGATRGALLLPQTGEFAICAALSVQQEQVVELEQQGLELAFSVVRYCARTVGSVVLSNASQDSRFAQDPFIAQGGVKSLACVPLVHQGQLVGVLYLENDTATGAFHAPRIERLEFLAGHAALAIQNARLYEDLQAANANLERRVQQRTAQLTRRNQDMRRVLDNVKQGLITVDLEGRLAAEHSRVVDEWFGSFDSATPLRSYLANIDSRFVENFQLAFEQLVEGNLPEELLLEQLPTRLSHAERQFQLGYQPIHVKDKLSSLLIVIDDVTEALRRARDEAEQKDVLSLCRHLSKDRDALLGFFEEGQVLLENLGSPDLDVLQRSLHTLKGNAAMYGFEVLAETCHRAEDALAERLFDAGHSAAVTEQFVALRAVLSSIAGESAAERIEVPRATLSELARQLAAGLPGPKAARAVERLLLEPIRLSFERLSQYARALARRMGKVEPQVVIEDEGLLIDGRRAAALFAALVHLVRNAIDHGLPDRDEAEPRAAEAVLSLRARLQGGQALIEIGDNGRGVDWERVSVRARELGLAATTRDELVAALFRAEFSTREHVTSVSGRGAGLAAVQAEVTRLSGRVSVESERGEGTRFRLFLAAEAVGLSAEEPSSDKQP